MIVTIYTCDRCGMEQDNDADMWGIGIAVDSHRYFSHKVKDLKHRALWCRACIVKIGLIPPSQYVEDPPAPEQPPTLEDVIREIIREEIS